MRVLTVNAGSSSLELRLLKEDCTLAAARHLPASQGPRGPRRRCVHRLWVAELLEVEPAGLRIVPVIWRPGASLAAVLTAGRRLRDGRPSTSRRQSAAAYCSRKYVSSASAARDSTRVLERTV